MPEIDYDHPNFDNNSRWPRRLLHVPSMTSCKWTPGNIYYGQENPSYVAISYTWGKYELDEQEMQDVRALPVRGVPWKVPRINPSTHFRVDEFQHICWETMKTPDKYYEFDREQDFRPGNGLSGLVRWVLRYLERHRMVYEFLWLDVACIEQRDSEIKWAEIGRQAQIFQGANAAYVWLSHTPYEVLVSSFEAFDNAVNKLQKEPFHSSASSFDASEGLEEAFLSLTTLTADPWFKSLWTLQEGYLRNHAIILSREGRVHCDRSKIVKTCLSLDYLYQRSSDVISWSERTQTQKSHPRLRDLLDLVRRTGLGALWLNNPVGLLGVSHNRDPQRPLDRVYGVMQIFGPDFRVGKAAHPDSTHEYSLDELENEFGKAILENYPILSQMHIYLEPPPPGKGWRVQADSVIPWMVERGDMFGWDGGNRLEINIEITPQALCELSTTTMGGTTWGHFSGLACPYRVLQQAWRDADESKDAVKLRQSQWRMHGMTTQSIHMMALDRGTHLRPVPIHLDTVNVKNLHENNKQHELASWVAARAEDPLLWVSLLGKCTFGDEIFNSGLIMFETVQGGMRYWRRVGICVWLYSHITGDSGSNCLGQVLSAQSDHWQQVQRTFG